MNPKTGIIILNYNGWYDTIECLQSVFQIEYDNYEVVLVDNASTDDSLLRIRTYCNNALKVDPTFLSHSHLQQPTRLAEYTGDAVEMGEDAGNNTRLLSCNKPLVLIKNERNCGFAEGVNIGVRYALNALDPEFILVLNNDALIDKDLLREMIDSADRDSRVGLVQPKVLRYADSKINETGILCDMLGSTQQRGWGEEDRGQYDEETDRGFFYAGGACLLVRRSMLRDLPDDCFDPYFFAYHEDTDLSWAARLLGYRVTYCPSALCWHKGGATSGGLNPKTAYLVYKNRLRVLIKNYSLTTLAAALPVTVLLQLFLLGAGAIVNTDPRYLRSFLKALSWNAVNLSSALSRRRFIQLKRTMTDKEVMQYMVCHSLEVDSALKALSLRRDP